MTQKRVYKIQRKYRVAQKHRRRNRSFLILLFVLLLLLGAVAKYRKEKQNQAGQIVQDVSFAADEPSQSIVNASPGSIPDYSGEDILVLNNNVPEFTQYDREQIHGEQYSPLDALGRCGTAYAMLDRSMMPEGEREEIGMIRPSGWHTVKYPELIEDRYLYNRCHLIAYCLTGQNANERNLITGTRYLNTVTMLPYETEIARYLDHSDHHVLYRVSPYFHGEELIARGVELEAYSVEDRGRDICFHVFLYNIQPGIVIDYRTGESREAAE